jgi:SAM-dependent methyltransferase
LGLSMYFNIGVKQKEYSIMFEMEDTHWWYLGHRHLYLSLLDKYCPKESRGRVLDAGCGTGGITQWFRDNFHPAYLAGIEIHEEAAARCRERGLDDVSCCSVEDIQFPEDSFDLAICLNVLYHREVKSELEALKEIRRVLAPGGYLLVSLPALHILRGSHDLAVGGVRRYRSKELEELIVEAGFEPVRVTYFSMFLLPIMTAFRIWSRIKDGKDIHSDFWLLPAPVNRALESLLVFESHLARSRDLPIGSSLVALAHLPS